jgi:hypothetical protein
MHTNTTPAEVLSQHVAVSASSTGLSPPLPPAAAAARPGQIATESATHQTKRTDLGSESGRSTDLTTDGSEVDDLLGGTKVT